MPLPAEQGSPAVARQDKRVPAGAWIRVVSVVAVIGTLLTIGGLMVNEVRIYRGAGRVVGAVRSSEIGDLPGLWRRYTRCRRAATCASASGGWRASSRPRHRRWPIA